MSTSSYDALPAWLPGSIEPLGEPGAVFASFLEQDSDCQSFGLELEGKRCFLKLSETPRGVASLSRATALHAAVQHEAIVPQLFAKVEEHRAVVIYPWIEADPLYAPTHAPGSRERRSPECPHARFRRLPVAEIEAALDRLYDAQRVLAEAGFVSCDFYDGCLLYDFTGRQIWIIDLDEYRLGPFQVEGQRLPGSTRFMAPEEFLQGSTIDERTTVYHLARAASILLDAGDSEGLWRGTEAQAAVAARGQRSEKAQRYQTVAEFVVAWTGFGEASRPDYVLRPSRAGDLEALLGVHEGAFRELTETRFDWDPSYQRQLVADSLPDSQIVEIQGQAVGQLLVEDRGDEIFLTRIMIHPRWQGRGVGRHIVEGILAQAASRRLPVTLSVWENNRARGLYERLGFRVTKEVEFRVKMRLDQPAPQLGTPTS